MPDSRASSDRNPHYFTMKTSTRQAPSAFNFPLTSQPNVTSSSSRPGKGPSRPSTPLGSPKMPYSVGQPYPPRLSPGRVPVNRSASPSYFGLVVDESVDPADSSLMPRHNWSPPSASVRPFAAAVPKQVPLDANPEFEAFRRQVDAYRGKGVASSYMQSQANSTISISRPKIPRWHTQSSDSTSSSDANSSKEGSTSTQDSAHEANRMDVDQESLQDSAYVSGESKRNSEACIAPFPALKLPSLDAVERTVTPLEHPMTLSKVEDRDPRLSVMGNRFEQSATLSSGSIRPQSVPSKVEIGGPTMIMPNMLRDMIEDPKVRLLLLDVRSAQSYARSRIRDALNLCIPTTLLKRATFNLAKLQKSFQQAEHQGAFSKWRDADCLVVYDASSSEKTEAMTAVNMIKKFTNEGFSSPAYILRGGFKFFEEQHPDLIYHQSAANPNSPNSGCGRLGLAPVIGGVMLPATGHTPNPFFANIRQNMDLADGVGQMDIRKPKQLETSTLPQWLRDAAEESNHGKQVSEKFLNIELEEQSRMKEAYSLINCDTDPSKRGCVQISGIEQGDKNRYKDILPFEHSRVKLKGDLQGRSDYFNASHVKSSKSNKRYLATQGPLPATFEDFWSVVWDQDVRVIVMLTAESEGGQLKCHAYWNSHEYGQVRLTKLSERKVSLDIDKQPGDSKTSDPTSAAEHGRRRANTTTAFETSASQPTRPQDETPYVVIRKFALCHSEHPFEPMREITHLHYPSWPDFGVPAQASHLLALVELANVMQRASMPVETTTIGAKKPSASLAWRDEPEMDSRARPMLVHCSAGCGRTGTFCTVDTVIDMLKRQRLNKLAQLSSQFGGNDSRIDGDASTGESAIAADASPVLKTPGSKPPSRRWSEESASSLPFTEVEPLDLSWLDSENLDLVQATVEDFRQQRLSMVQSLRQYVLCYEAVLEWTWRIQERGRATDGVLKKRARSGSLQFPRE